MKYIKDFKNLNESVKDDLINHVDDDLIEKFYDKEYVIDDSELAYICPSCVTNNFDFDKFKDDFIYDMISESTFDNYDDYEFKEYIEEHLTDEKKNKIIELYNENNDEENKEFDDDYLSDLDSEQLKEVIEEDDDEYDFVKYIVERIYGDYSGEEIFEEFYGMSDDIIDKQNKNSYSYNKPDYESFGEYLWKEYNHYIDRTGMLKDWINGEDFTYKTEFVMEYIENNIELQKNILKNDEEQVLNLAELFIEEPGDNISKEYNFQKLYIEKFLENELTIGGVVFDDEEEKVIEEKTKAITFLNDNFGLNKILEKELRKENHSYFVKIDSQGFNL